MDLSQPQPILRGQSTAKDPRSAVAELRDQIGRDDFSYGVFFASNSYAFEEVAQEVHRQFGDLPIIGSQSGGEIGPSGYCENSIVGFSFGNDFASSTVVIPNLNEFRLTDGAQAATEALSKLTAKTQDLKSHQTFGFLLIDGLSRAEEPVTHALYQSLPDIPLFGGSSSDGLRFGRAPLYAHGKVHLDAAIFSLVHTQRVFEVFKTQHFDRTNTRMVVTEADPSTRTVTEINGEPAAIEYAECCGKDLGELDSLIFAMHPVSVRVGGTDYIRSIMRVNEDKSMEFACAIDEGIVLSVAQANDMISDLKNCFQGLSQRLSSIDFVLGCDCILRTLECDQAGIRPDVGSFMSAQNVLGFSTYGEQYHAMHVNQTFTGVAISDRIAP